MKEFILIFIHLYSVIVFVGYVFFDCVICAKIENMNKFKKAYFKSSGIIYAISFILLIFTGIMIAIDKFHLFSNVSKIIFVIKILLIIFMIAITIISIIILKRNKNSNNFLVKKAHIIALILCFLIVLLAKLL
ncbi:trehalose-6-phosphate synthase [Campylobacter sp. MG1]|uniref:trehalose-6-phosphate synthase n=1 Tax=Campylobacter sp. MG1 TaxID=2976332 RepID=UPI00226CB968|nr:trehalose-6-phosphate synthase [Campylobacter sp. MG1]